MRVVSTILWASAIPGLLILCSGCGIDDGDSCTPLSEMTAYGSNDCPPTWEQAQAKAPTVCDEAFEFSTTLSRSPCEGYLRYTAYLFDGGPRYCLYDPTTFALVGYGISDTKALHEEYSCGIDQALFAPETCSSTAENACPASTSHRELLDID